MPEIIKNTQTSCKCSDAKWEKIFGKRVVKSLIAKPKEQEKEKSHSQK